MSKRFSDKVVLVTGAGSGIGEAAAKAFAAEGGKLVLAGIGLESVQRVAEEIRQAGGQALAVQADVCSQVDCEAMVAQALEQFGRLDIAFNNAGIAEPEPQLTADLDPEVYRRVMAVNAEGVFLSLRAQIPAMLAGGGGAIVNASSLLGIQAFPYQFAYIASKHAVVGMTRAVASEYAGQGIRCNAIAPVTVQGTSMGNELVEGEAWEQIQALIPVGRAAQIDDIVNAVLWLSSEQASFIHGHVLPIDGGMHVW